MLEPSKIGITTFGSLKLQIWILQKQHRICNNSDPGGVKPRDWHPGPTHQWDGDRGDARRRRSLTTTRSRPDLRAPTDLRTPGRTRGGGRFLTKLNRVIQSSPTVTETRTLSTFYSQLNRWFWLGFDPLDRATRVLQLWLQDRSLTRSGFQTTRLPITLGRNCVIQHLAKFG